MIKFPQIARSNTDAGGPLTEAAEPTRTKIADRLWINDAGESVDEEHATGFSYEFHGRTKDGVTIPADGEKFTRFIRDMSEAEKNMLIIFGATTLSGNVTNTWMGDKDADKAPKACAAIAARFQDLYDGKWLDRVAGGVGSRTNLDALAEAMTQLATPEQLKGRDHGQFKADARAKLESPDFARKVRSIPEVAAKYATIIGKPAGSLETLLADV